MTVERHGSVGALEQEWEGLAERVHATPFLRPGWIDIWWRAFGRGELEIIVLRDGGELRAVLPLMRRGPSMQSPTNWHTPLYGVLSADHQATAELLRGLVCLPRRWLDLSLVDSDDALVQELPRIARDLGAATISRPVLRSPYIELAGDWESFEAGLSKRFRGKLSRTRRRLEEQGPLEISVSDGREGVDALLSEAFAIERAGWKGQAGTAIASQPETERFYREIARWAADRRWLRLTFMRLNGRCVAFDYAIVQNGSLFGLKGGFDPAYRTYGPGMLMVRETIAHAYSEGLSTYEFLGDAEPYKLIWTKRCRQRLRMQVFPATLTGRAGLALWSGARPVAKRCRAGLGRARQVIARRPGRG
jgi:CelD/BcsL family acetyltransferase involved in cellulose biosynthesis